MQHLLSKKVDRIVDIQVDYAGCSTCGENHTLILMIEKTRHKTAVVIGTLSHVPNYPKKLKIYLNNASPYWQAVYWDRGKTHRKSLKTTDKRTAYINAKAFYEQIIVSKYNNPSHLAHYQIKVKEDFEVAPDLKLKAIVVQWLARKSAKWSANHTRQIELRLTNNILKYLADRNIRRITRKEILTLLQKMETRGACELAKRVLSDLRQIWQYAMVIGVCKDDITVGLNKALHERSIVHFVAIEPKELPELMNCIAQYDKPGDLIVKYCLQMMALTFVRKTELIRATWDEFDLEKAVWKIPANRMKMRVEHLVPLSKQTLSLLQCIKTEYPSQHLVFHKANKPLVDHALIYALYTMGYNKRMTVHGFRAVASTILNENKFRSDVIERQLAHAEGNQVRRAYNRAQYMTERIEMMDWWGDYLESMTPFTEG